jgi:environmental stress-induced protein Ves
MQILRAADRIATPWKNGGGETYEIAASPPGAGLDAFDWRISIARLHASGPFSHFPGIARLTAMLEGEVVLTVRGQAPARLTPATPAHAYPGDADTHGELIGEAALDLNVMTRATVCSARLTKVSAPQTLTRSADRICLIALSDLKLTGAEGAERLNRLDAAIWTDEDVVIHSPGDAWLIEIMGR